MCTNLKVGLPVHFFFFFLYLSTRSSNGPRSLRRTDADFSVRKAERTTQLLQTQEVKEVGIGVEAEGGCFLLSSLLRLITAEGTRGGGDKEEKTGLFLVLLFFWQMMLPITPSSP